jgi:regulator of protease activity HflC (stomatin/prohibitin superfamily)
VRRLTNGPGNSYKGPSFPPEKPNYSQERHSSSIESTFARVELEGHLTAARSHIGRINTIVNICPQQEVWIVERLGKYLETVGGGMHFYIPIVDSISYRFSMKEQALIIPSRSAITKDNVRIHCVGVLYYKIFDPYAAAYGCGDPVFSLSQLAQTSLRSVIGKLTLDETFHERNLVNSRVVETCNEAAKVWGITCLRHEIREIQPPDNVLHAMEMQMEAERKKRVDILQSEGEQQSVVNRAEAHKRELILQSEATKQHAINVAEGEASSAIIQARAQSTAQQLVAEGAALALERIAQATKASGGADAIQFELATKYIDALSHMAKTNNTMIVPSNVADISSMLAQATSVIKNIQSGSSSSL